MRTAQAEVGTTEAPRREENPRIAGASSILLLRPAAPTGPAVRYERRGIAIFRRTANPAPATAFSLSRRWGACRPSSGEV